VTAVRTAMTSRERVMAAVRGGEVDRVPFAVWRHFYPDELDAPMLAATTIAFTTRFRLDLIKFNPRAHYHGEPWGTRYEYSGREKPRLLKNAVERTEDWAKIDRRGIDEPAFQYLLDGLRRVRKALPEIPLLATIFTPLGAMQRLATPVQLLDDLREHPDAVLPALEAVTETFRALAAACVEICDGIFLATTPAASRSYLTDDEYARFGIPYDLRVLEGARGAALNVLHVCGDDAPVIALGRRYDVAAVSWNAFGREDPPLDAFLAAVPGKGAIGGISDAAWHDPDQARLDARVGRDRTGGRRWIAAGSCTIPVDSLSQSIDAARDALATRSASPA
jgi:uroporphyrinogen decarboxylase